MPSSDALSHLPHPRQVYLFHHSSRTQTCKTCPFHLRLHYLRSDLLQSLALKRMLLLNSRLMRYLPVQSSIMERGCRDSGVEAAARHLNCRHQPVPIEDGLVQAAKMNRKRQTTVSILAKCLSLEAPF